MERGGLKEVQIRIRVMGEGDRELYGALLKTVAREGGDHRNCPNWIKNQRAPILLWSAI